MKIERFNELILKHTPEGVRSLGKPKTMWVLAHGLCFYYSYVFINVLGGEAVSYVTKNMTGHSFVKLNGLYFDSENSQGQISWRKLQTYLRSTPKRAVIHKKMSGLVKTWNLSRSEIDLFNSISEKIRRELVD